MADSDIEKVTQNDESGPSSSSGEVPSSSSEPRLDPANALIHPPMSPLHPHTSLTHAISQHPNISNATSLASIDRPPSVSSKTHLPLPAAKVYHPFSPHVLALLLPASIFGVLTRLGLQALVGYDGRAIFPLAWVQAVGCFVMGVGLGVKEPFGQL